MLKEIISPRLNLLRADPLEPKGLECVKLTSCHKASRYPSCGNGHLHISTKSIPLAESFIHYCLTKKMMGMEKQCFTSLIRKKVRLICLQLDSPRSEHVVWGRWTIWEPIQSAYKHIIIVAPGIRIAI